MRIVFSVCTTENECKFSCSDCQMKKRCECCSHNIGSECGAAAARHQPEDSSRRPYVRWLQYSRTPRRSAIRTTDTVNGERSEASIWTRSPEFRHCQACLTGFQTVKSCSGPTTNGLNTALCSTILARFGQCPNAARYPNVRL